MRSLFLPPLIVLFLVLSSSVVAAPEPGTQDAATQSSSPADAASVYAEGKKLYDAGDYTGARGKFAEAARRDPGNARWFYNLGLAQRQLDNYQAARQAFMRARELDPAYKKKEIDDKLVAMGFDPATGAEEQPRSRLSVTDADQDSDGAASAQGEEDWTGWAIGLGGLAFIVTMFLLLLRLFRGSGAKAPTRQDPAALAKAEADAGQLAGQLVKLEHVMRLGEHGDLRSLLEHATLLEASARQALGKAQQGNPKALQQAQQQISEAAQNASRAMALATQLYGDQAFAGEGERIGCFFCARPLANAEVRQPVGMKRGAETDTVISCPDCAAQAARGEAPRIRTGNGQQAHWSDEADFDPYRARHSDGPVRRVPVQDFRPMQPVSQLAQQAGGAAMLGVGALAGAGAAMAASHFLDLDALQASEQTQQAASETANRVRERNSSSSDHS